MKAVLAVVVISCLLVMASSQDVGQCSRRALDLANCLSAGTTGATYCNDCASQLRSYYNDCLTGTARTSAINALNSGESKMILEGQNITNCIL